MTHAVGAAVDEGVLSPVTAGHDGLVADVVVVDALVEAELALVRAWAALGVAPADAVAAIVGTSYRIDPAVLAADAVAGGNPVIPLLARIREAVPPDAVRWVHRGATSQDILDSALMLVAARAVAQVQAHLDEAAEALRALAVAQRDTVAVARTLTQHAVPTTVGLRAATWLRVVRRSRERLTATRLPAQLGGAGGTLASFVELAGADVAARLPAAFAAELGLAAPDAPWHVTRWPVTELGDALVQVVDALGKIATDVATLSRTELAELAEGAGGGSSAMPQKQNPVASVLVRSAALRAPHLGAALHAAAALASDERPDGAWHAEWPTLRELLRLVLGASATAARLLAGLRVDTDATARNLALSGSLLLAERLALVLTPLIGAGRVAQLVSAAAAGDDLGALVRALPEAAGIDVDALLDPAAYTGLAGRLTDAASDAGTEPA